MATNFLNSQIKEQLLKESLIFNSRQPAKIKQNKIVYEKYKNYFDSIQEFLYYYKNPIKAEQENKCKACGKKTHFKVIWNKYNSFCSSVCANQYNAPKIAKTILNKYGVSCIFKDKEKIRNSYLQKLGVDNPSKLESVKQKVKNTLLNKIDDKGLNGYQQIALKTRQTNLKNIDENGLNGYQQNAVKIKQTFLKKYNVSHFTKTQEYKDRYKNKKWVEESQNKRAKTMIANKSYAKSKQEDLVYEKLINLFGQENIIRQYKNEIYPYKCDFYIKTLDTYIECNFFWTHGKYKNKILGEFDKNNKDHLKVLSLWKEKAKTNKAYIDAINTWTKLDVKKNRVATKNKLNYYVYYNIKPFNTWGTGFYGNQLP